MTGSSINFNLSLQQAQNLFRSADGNQPHSDPQYADDWADRSANIWGVGYNDSFELTAGVFGEQDGILSFIERERAVNQITYDQSDTARTENDTNVNSSPITYEQAQNGNSFLNSIFYNSEEFFGERAGELRDGLDFDGDGNFTIDDLNVLAAMDGDATNVTDTDMDKAFELFSSTAVDDTDEVDETNDTDEIDEVQDPETTENTVEETDAEQLDNLIENFEERPQLSKYEGIQAFLEARRESVDETTTETDTEE